MIEKFNFVPWQEIEINLNKDAADNLLRCGWRFLEKTLDMPTDARSMIIDRKNARLIEVESTWESDSLDSITVRSFCIGYSLGEGVNFPIPKFEAELCVTNQGVYELHTKESIEKYQIQGNVSNGWVNQVQEALNYHLK